MSYLADWRAAGCAGAVFHRPQQGMSLCLQPIMFAVHLCSADGGYPSAFSRWCLCICMCPVPVDRSGGPVRVLQVMLCQPSHHKEYFSLMCNTPGFRKVVLDHCYCMLRLHFTWLKHTTVITHSPACPTNELASSVTWLSRTHRHCIFKCLMLLAGHPASMNKLRE